MLTRLRPLIPSSKRHYTTMHRPWKRLVRFESEKQIYYGEASEDLKTAKIIEGPIFGECTITSKVAPIQKILAPLEPNTVIGIGLNYQRHAFETKNPVPQEPIVSTRAFVLLPTLKILLSFLSMSSTPTRSDGSRITQDPPEVDYEAELVIVIGKTCKNVSKEKALEYVAGYTTANDVSARRWQGQVRGGSQWCFAKSFDTFCPLGPVIVSSEIIKQPNNLKIQSVLNGKVMQSSNTSDMIFDVPTLISFVSQSTTLLPGTIILTGTPEGVGFSRDPPVYLKSGDSVTIKIESIGEITNIVINEQEAKL